MKIFKSLFFILILIQNLSLTLAECNLELAVDKCSYVKSNCSDEVVYLNYLEMYYCQSYWNILSILFILIMLFITISICASSFMTSSIQQIQNLSRQLPSCINRNGRGISDTVMGVTFLAFGNGVGDLIGSFIGINNDASSLVLGELMGAALFVNTIVIGLILILYKSSLKINQGILIRDLLFFIVAVVYLLIVVSDQKITLTESLLLILYYLAYVLYVTTSGAIYNLFKKQNIRLQDQDIHDDNYLIEQADRVQFSLDTKGLQNIGEDDFLVSPNAPGKDSLYFYKFGAYGKKLGTYRVNRKFDYQQLDDAVSLDQAYSNHSNNLLVEFDKLYDQEPQEHRIGFSDQQTIFDDSKSVDTSISGNRQSSEHQSQQLHPDEQFSRLPQPLRTIASNLFYQNTKYGFFPNIKQLQRAFFPFDEQWSEMSILSQFVSILSIPSYILLSLIIPNVDEDCVSLDDIVLHSPGSRFKSSFQQTTVWNRWLLLLQSITVPLFAFYVFEFNLLYSIPIILISFVYLTFKTNPVEIPESTLFRTVLTFTAFLMSTFVIYHIAQELLSLLVSLGIIFNISQEMIGLTVFAIGNSMADFIANLAVAKMGYANMALSACIGGPLLNILLGIGVSSSYYNLQHQFLTIQISRTLIVSTISLLVAIVFTFSITLWNMKALKQYGLVLILIYLVQMVVNIILEALKV